MVLLDKLRSRWQLKSTLQVIIVLIVFALTGTTVMLIKKPLFAFLETSEEYNTLFTVLYYIFILPVYNLILLFYGFIFGQFAFFWNFEKKMWSRMTRRKTNDNSEQEGGS